MFWCVCLCVTCFVVYFVGCLYCLLLWFVFCLFLVLMVFGLWFWLILLLWCWVCGYCVCGVLNLIGYFDLFSFAVFVSLLIWFAWVFVDLLTLITFVGFDWLLVCCVFCFVVGFCSINYCLIGLLVCLLWFIWLFVSLLWFLIFGVALGLFVWWFLFCFLFLMNAF